MSISSGVAFWSSSQLPAVSWKAMMVEFEWWSVTLVTLRVYHDQQSVLNRKSDIIVPHMNLNFKRKSLQSHEFQRVFVCLRLSVDGRGLEAVAGSCDMYTSMSNCISVCSKNTNFPFRNYSGISKLSWLLSHTMYPKLVWRPVRRNKYSRLRYSRWANSGACVYDSHATLNLWQNSVCQWQPGRISKAQWP